MSKRLQSGFALLEVLLAIILFSVASYGTYVAAKSYHLTATLQNFEQYALSITENYAPFLAGTASSDVLDTSSSDYGSGYASVDFLTSIGVPTDSLPESTSGEYTTVYSGFYAGGSQSEMSFYTIMSDDYTIGSNYFIIATTTTGSQLIRLAQDMASSYSIYYGDEGESLNNAIAANDATNFEAITSGSDTLYSAFMIYPKTNNYDSVLSDTTGITPVSYSNDSSS